MAHYAPIPSKDSSPLPAVAEYGDTKSLSSSVLDRGQRRRDAIHSAANRSGRKSLGKPWRPLQLRTPVSILIVLLCLCAVFVLEAALRLNQNAYGWELPLLFRRFQNYHVFLTAVPGFFSWLLVQQLMAIDRYIKQMQPYVDMTKGRATAARSVLLSYPQRANILILPRVIQNGHFTVLISTILCLVAAALSPLSTSYIFSQAPPPGYLVPLKGIQVQEQLRIPSSLDVSKLDAAAGFMKAASSFSIDPPPFVRFNPESSWTASGINMSSSQPGIVYASVPCIQSFANCSNSNSVTYNTNTGIISGNTQFPSCSFSTRASDSEGFTDSPFPFGITQVTCTGVTDSFEKPVVFWVLKNVGSQLEPLATVCKPNIEAQQATAILNGTTLSLLDVQDPVPLNPALVGVDLRSTPFNGTAFNGLFPSNASATSGDQKSLNSTIQSLGKAVAVLVGANSAVNASADFLTSTTTVVYAHYLGMITSTLYFTSLQNSTIDGSWHPVEDRLFISPLITHVLAFLFSFLGVGAVIIFILHSRDKKGLKLGSPPVTIASAVAVAGQSELSYLLDGRDTTEEMEALLSDMTFRIDPKSGRLRVEEDYTSGYSGVAYG